MHQERELLQAEKALAALTWDIQDQCQHHRVLFAEWEPLVYIGGSLHARRICMDCGFEETSSSSYGWSGENSGDGSTTLPKGAPLRLTTDFLKKADRSVMYRYRPRTASRTTK